MPWTNQIRRLNNLSSSEFATTWTDTPFILIDPVKQWPLYDEWCQGNILDKFGDTIFRAEAVDWPLRTYIEYMKQNIDESPLYLFDSAFLEKMNLQVGRSVDGAYWSPECFGEDLFALFGDRRPDSRWLIIGPERSGSTFHQDPNATSAWNAVIRGSKYWIMFPHEQCPPGVFVSEDQSEVTSPLGVAEWLLTYQAEARHAPGCLEGVCGEGEILHIPSGWWHLVVNLEPAIAITENFVPKSHLKAAVNFLENRPNQVSGFASDVEDPCGLFFDILRTARPDLLDLLGLGTKKKRKWGDVVQRTTWSIENENRGFSFSFGDDTGED